jgi:hypothetical protein
MIKTILPFLFVFASSICHASGEWIPLNNQQILINEQIITTTQISRPLVPQLVVKYQLVPHVVLETTQVEKRYIFRTVTEVKTVPVTKWVYQPYYSIE